MSNAIMDRRRFHQDTNKFFKRLAEQQGIDIGELRNPELRVDLIKKLSADQFLELMTVANAKLQGIYKRWDRDYEGTTHTSYVGNYMQDSPDLDPPSNSKAEFSSFYEDMQAGIDKDNILFWAAKLYTAIIFLHMFPDSNGRLARNAFSFLDKGEMLEVQFSAERPSLIKDYCEKVNIFSIERLLVQNGCTRFDYKAIGGLQNTLVYQADERKHIHQHSELGLVARLKFIAAKRAGILKQRAKNQDSDGVSQCFEYGLVIGYEGESDENGFGEYYEIETSPWTDEELSNFFREYEVVKSEWFRESQKVIDDYPKLTQLWLELALYIPNNYHLNLSSFISLSSAVIENRSQDARRIIDENKRAPIVDDTEVSIYLNELDNALNTRPSVIEAIKDIAN